MSDDTYDLDLGKIRGALNGLHGLGERARVLKGQYLADHERYKGWNGDPDDPDDFYKKTEPDDEKTTLTLTETIDSFGLAIEAVESALLESLDSVKAVHADVTELIAQQERLADSDSDSGYESNDEDSSDDESGSGKH
ncbi:hypothetical protein AB4Z54_03880 [Streptomyces sp. MCAF7]